VRETLRNEVSPIERMSLHLAIGEALEGDGGDEEMAARLAYHFFQANAAGGAAKAVHYARLAAAAAERASAYEGAAALTQRALDALRFLPPDEPRRCELLIALGRAQRRAGRIPEARAAFRRAAQIAHDIGAVDLAATAALGFGQVGETGRVDADLTRLLADSLTLLGETDSALRCRILARLAMALYFSTDAADGQRRDAMSAGAVQMARRLDDREALGAALVARHFVLWRPGTTAERLALSAELIELALSLRDEELELEARLWHALDLLESGNGPGYAAAVEAFRRLAGTAKLPIYEWHLLVLDALWALACGELDAAARAAEAARDLGGDYHIERAAQFFAAQMFFHRRDRGELVELEPALRAFADQLTALPVWRCGLALLYADLGRTAEAERALRAALATDPSTWPADGSWLPCLAMLAEVCATVDDREGATRLLSCLEPHAGTQVVLFDGIALLGPVEHYLGLLAATLQDAERAPATSMRPCSSASAWVRLHSRNVRAAPARR
jgi:tetratricopeptide (TPR) repeat protein